MIVPSQTTQQSAQPPPHFSPSFRKKLKAPWNEIIAAHYATGKLEMHWGEEIIAQISSKMNSYHKTIESGLNLLAQSDVSGEDMIKYTMSGSSWGDLHILVP